MDINLTTRYYEICELWSDAIYYDTATVTTAALPAWITGTLDLPNTVMNLEFDPTGVTAGTYTYDMADLNIVVTVKAACSTDMEACCTNAVNVQWLNREGGWQNMYFARVHGYDLRAAGSQTFTNGITVKYQSKGKVFEGERLKIAVKNRAEYDYLIGLKYSIQAFVDGVEILIDEESFPKYDENTRVYEIGFSFIWAKEKVVQGQ